MSSTSDSELSGHILPELIPQHVAVIMDGNGRWAKSRGLPRLEGHRRGADKARDIVEWASDAGVRQISLYAFSTENWSRPDIEVRGLMALLATLLPKQIPDMNKNGVRLKVLGDVQALPGMARRAVLKACEKTAGNRKIDLVLCLNYGGQQEILAAARKLAISFKQGEISDEALQALSPEDFRNYLWRHDLMPVDLLIRTGGEHRISNFHLWDMAYAELFFDETYWPDYSREDFLRALHVFVSRERRFGKTSEQVTSNKAQSSI